MTARMSVAVKKASKARLLDDFRAAHALVNQVNASWHPALTFSRGFVLGAVEASGSLTVKAALLTAFGG
jgi:hypothetical protein